MPFVVMGWIGLVWMCVAVMSVTNLIHDALDTDLGRAVQVQLSVCVSTDKYVEVRLQCFIHSSIHQCIESA